MATREWSDWKKSLSLSCDITVVLSTTLNKMATVEIWCTVYSLRYTFWFLQPILLRVIENLEQHSVTNAETRANSVKYRGNKLLPSLVKPRIYTQVISIQFTP